MKKIILALFVSGMIFLSSSSVSLAAVCSGAPDGVHHFDAHRRLYAGYSVDIGTHSYLYGYVNGEAIYRNDCSMKENYEYCDLYCIYCGTTYVAGRHVELTSISHSVRHQ